MKDGIYFVEFISNNNAVGQGTVVVNGDTVNGGDFGFTYQGRVHGNRLDLNVFQHNPQAVNVLGVNNYTMELSILDNPGGFVLDGAVKGTPHARLQVRAKFIGDLI